MTILEHQVTASYSDTEAPPRSGRVWGLTLRRMHDCYWASRRVAVIRRGEAPSFRSRPDLYLLLEPDELILFSLAPIVKRLTWVKPRAIRLRITDPESHAYSERVETDQEDRFIRIRRDYGARTRATARAWLTTDASLAAMWAQATTRANGARGVKRRAGEGQVLPMRCEGRVLSDADEGLGADSAARLMLAWRRPSDVLDGVYEYADGVWAHETSRIMPGARFVPPVWVGAGVRVGEADVVVGPALVADASLQASAAQRIDFDDIRRPALHWIPRGIALGSHRYGKRAFDIVFSLLVLLATAPLYPLIAIAIVAEDGWPVFFSHRRQTIRGREFPCLKFRTMCRGAESMKTELASRNVCDGPQFFIENDPRLLKIGRVLRRFQLDELPQFLNVLLGHMSVVGPRPSPDRENQYCPAWREARLSVRPGITGLWQVRRTREPQTDFQEWIRYDLEYVRHQSWRLDLWVIMQTVTNVLRRG